MAKGNPKIGQLSLGDAFAIALAKSVGERILSPIIGNATIMSGGIKIGGAILIKNMLGGKIGDIVSTALVVDGTEDIVTPLISGGIAGLSIGGSGNNSEVI